MNDAQRPAEPAGDDKERPTGFAAVARRLNDLYPNRKRPISRQLVHKWYLYRHHNGFPASTAPAGSGGSERPDFNMRDVEKWYVKYRSSHGDPHIGQQNIPQNPQNIQGEEGNSLAA